MALDQMTIPLTNYKFTHTNPQVFTQLPKHWLLELDFLMVLIVSCKMMVSSAPTNKFSFPKLTLSRCIWLDIYNDLDLFCMFMYFNCILAHKCTKTILVNIQPELQVTFTVGNISPYMYTHSSTGYTVCKSKCNEANV